MNLEQACDLVKEYAYSLPWGLAMHKVANQTRFSTKELGAEFGRRRKGKKKKVSAKQMELGL